MERKRKNGRMNWTHVIRADIDLALKHSDTLPEFMEHMKMAGYSVRAGKSKKKNATYFTYTYTDEAGKNTEEEAITCHPDILRRI